MHCLRTECWWTTACFRQLGCLVLSSYGRTVITGDGEDGLTSAVLRGLALQEVEGKVACAHVIDQNIFHKFWFRVAC